LDSPWTMKYYFYTFKNPTGRRASVREFFTRQTCKICDYHLNLITNSVATTYTCIHTDKYAVVRRFLRKNTPFLQLKALIIKLSNSAFSMFSNVREVNLVYPIHNGSCLYRNGFCKESMSVPFSSFSWILASPESGQRIVYFD
jgi:transposase-like protein